MIAWILAFALVLVLVSIGMVFVYKADAETSEEFRAETNAFNSRLLLINLDLQQELKRTSAERDAISEELAQERADRLIKDHNTKVRTKAAQKRKVAA